MMDEQASFGISDENLAMTGSESRNRRRLDAEERMRLKQTRANAKRAFTRALNRVAETMLAESSLSELITSEVNLKTAFGEFCRACELYRNSLVEEDDLDQSRAYCHEAEVRFLAMKDRIALRFEHIQKSDPDRTIREQDVTPEDSVSQVYSTNNSCQSSRSSKQSSQRLLQETRLANATRRASLIAEASFLKMKQSLANQEIQLQQQKEDLEMKIQLKKLEAEDEVCNDFETVISYAESAPLQKHKSLPRWYFGSRPVTHAQSAPLQLPMPGVLPSGVSRSVAQDHVIGAPPQSVVSHSFGEPVNPHAQSAPPQLHMPGVSRSGVSRSVAQDHVIGAPPQSVVSHSFGEPVNPHTQSAPPQLHMPGVLPSGVSRSVALDHVIGAPPQSVVSHSFGEPVNPHAQSAPPQLPIPGVSRSGVSRSVAQDHVIAAPPQSVVSHSFGEPVNLNAQSAPPQLPMPGVLRSGVSNNVISDHEIGAPPQLPFPYLHDKRLNAYVQPAPSRRLAPESGSHAFDNTAAVNQPANISVPQIQQSVTCISQEAPRRYDMNVPSEDNISMQEEINDPGIEYLETMRKLATATLLPKSELMTFDGDPLKYFSFIKTFENNVEKDICDSSRQLQLLIQYCTGKAKKVIENCILLSPSEGYKEAKKLLFGNVYKVTNSWICKVTNGPVIKPGDREALIDLADDLHNCELTLKATGRLNQVNNEDCLVKILERCPGFVKSRWQSKVYEFRERGHNPNIEDVRKLVRMVAVEKNDPVFGAIMERDGSKQTTRDKRMRRPGQVADKSSHNKHVNFKIQTTAEQKPKDTESNARCYLCEGKHKLEACEDFKSKTGEEQLQFIRSHKLCDSCLSSNHFSTGCKRRNECKVPDCPLRRKHMTSLHESVMAFEKKRRKTTTSGATRDQQQSRGTSKSQFVGSNMHTGAGCSKGLTIVPVKIKGNGQNKVICTYAMLDTESTASFCTEDILKKLGISGTRCKMSLATVSNEKQHECVMVNLDVMDLDENVMIEVPNAFSVKKLNVSLESITKQDDVDNWSYLNGVTVPRALTNHDVGLLIGVDVPEALEPEEIRRAQDGGPYAVKTKFGWTLNGPLGRYGKERKQCYLIPSCENDDMLKKQFKQYINRDFCESTADSCKAMSMEDKKALAVLEDTAKLVDGHYQLAIPWRDIQPCLPNNRSVAEHRLKHLKRKLSRDVGLCKKYTNFIDDLMVKDYARKVPQDQVNRNDGAVWYLPHHNVFNPKKPEKVRIVFDCAATYRGKSLNDNILQGPDFTNSLVGVLLRFRQESVALMADIESMFHQVRVHPKDVDALRFLWFPNGDLSKDPEEYQMLVHLFGGVWSPCCASYALRKTAVDNADRYGLEVTETVRRNFYVDDLLKSMKDAESAIRMYKEVTELLSHGGFHLTKWTSNKREALEVIPDSELSKELKNVDFEKDTLPTERALGLQWNTEQDKFQYNIGLKDKPETRRGILSIVSSVYDPLGFVSPFILRAKMILHQLCRKKLAWDDPVPEEELQCWKQWLAELQTLQEFSVDRCLKPETFGEPSMTELHHFSDASEGGYGAVSYIRMTDSKSKVHCAFVTGKSRLSPLKYMTIPRLELSAATVAVKLDQMIRKELDYKINRSFFWTDSQAVLRYIYNENRRFQTFVANRLAIIHDGSDSEQWRYIDTASNPADDASRGLHAHQLSNGSRWIQGPSFLWQSEEPWLVNPKIGEIPDDDVELKTKVQSFTVSNEKQASIISLMFLKFSDWMRLKKAVAWILRFKQWMQSKIQDAANQLVRTGHLTVEEVHQAEKCIIWHVQKEVYEDEINRLKSRVVVSKSSSLGRLDPVMVGELLSVGGRLKHAALSDEAKHPVILPKKHHIVDLIVRHYHHKSGHSGVEHVLSLIRERFRIVKARVAVRKIINECFNCKKRSQRPGLQKMADLPPDRVSHGMPPFTYVGCDCFGPFMVKRRRCQEKRYGVIFTCLAVRAVHIEVIHGMDTDSFIHALRRFMSRRGKPQEMRSDNGTNFVGGNRELQEAIDQWNQDKLHQHFLQQEIKWIPNPPKASHMGGVWERVIRSIRKIMQTLLREQLVDDEGLQTLFCEIESIINGRPLTKVSDDPKDANALTPNHLLLLKSNECFPPGIFVKSDGYSRRRWRQVQYLADLFWRRWTREYLPILQMRQKWQAVKRNFTIDDIVLVMDESLPRGYWPLARVTEVTKGRDGLVRSVKVKTSKSELFRPIDKLCLLEAAEDRDNE